MHAKDRPSFLLASADPNLLRVLETVFASFDEPVHVAMNAHSALERLTGENLPLLVVLDANLPGMELGQLLASARCKSNSRDFPIVLVADAATQEYSDRLVEGIIDDLVLRTATPDYWKLRIDLVLRTHSMGRELDALREASALQMQMDRLTGVYNRDAILSILFRETDRAQRMNSPLCVVLFDIDDFGHWNERLGVEACDDLLAKVAERTQGILRSYDVLGRPGKDEFLLVLPGCTTENAMLLADRLRMDVFSAPYRTGGESIRLSACFGVATSLGRSPVVVLREAEQALRWAKEQGPESIEYFSNSGREAHAPVTYLSPSSGDELLAW